MLDGSSHLMGLLDRDGVVLEANQNALTLIGVELESVLGRPFWETGWWSHDAVAQQRLRQAIAAAAAGHHDHFLSNHPTADGGSDAIEFSLSPVFNDAGEVVFLLPEGHAATAWRRDADKVEQERRRLQSLLDATDHGTWELHLQPPAAVLDERWAATVGYTLAELQPISFETFRTLTHPDDFEAASAHMDKHFKGTVDRYEAKVRLKHRAGHWVWVHVRGRVVEWASDGSPLLVIGTQQDITKSKLEAEELARLSRWASETTDGVIVTDAEHKVTWVNGSFGQLTGYGLDDMIGKTPSDVLTGSMTPQVAEVAGAAIRDESPFRVECLSITKTGTPWWASIHGMPLHDPNHRLQGFIIVLTNIDERKRLDVQQGRNEALLREVGVAASVGGWSLDLRTNALEWTEVTRRIHEVDDDFRPTVEEAVAFYAPEARAPLEAALKTCVATGTPWDLVLPFVTANGSPRWVRTIGRREFVAGEATHLIGAFQDVTAEQSRAVALREALRKNEMYLDTVQSMVIALSSTGIVQMANARACDSLGRPESDLVGTDWFATCVSPATSSAERTQFDKVMDGARLVDGYRESAIEANGHVRLIAWKYALLTDDSGTPTGMLLSGEDMTRRRELEGHIHRTQRLEALGNLAGGIAHDLNNSLTPIALSVELLRDKLADDPDLLHLLVQASSHASGVVRQLLAFAKGTQGDHRPIDAGHVVLELEALIQSLLLKSVRLLVSTDDGAMFDGDATQVQQVLMNLCVNARDAMPAGGELRLEVTRVVLTTEPIGVRVGAPVRRAEYVVIRIADTGTGMSPEVLDRAFEPFFSTKSEDKGSGLGLSSAAGIVEAHGGFMVVRSTLEGGTVVEVHFPARVTGLAARPESEVFGASAPEGHGEQVLVIDDEPAIRLVLVRVLASLGYQATAVSDGASAMLVLQTPGHGLAAVLTDLHMPGLTGLDIARWCRAHQPVLPLIVASGIFNAQVLGDLQALGVEIIDKPMGTQDVARAMRQALAGQRAAAVPEAEVH